MKAHREIQTEMKSWSSFEGELVIRCYLSMSLKLSVTVTPLDPTYINRSRALCRTHAPLDYDSRAKHTSRGSWDTLVERSTCDELLLCDDSGSPLESNNANIWSLELKEPLELIEERLKGFSSGMMRGLVWKTPPLNGQILPGITRALLLKYFRSEGALVYEETLPSLKDKSLDRTEIAFYLSSTLKSLSWVSAIDHRHFNELRINPAIFSAVEHYLSQC